MGRVYVVQFSNVAVTVAQDLFEVKAAADKVLILHEAKITQHSDVDSEQLRFSIKRVTGSPTSGSGGSAPTPAVVRAGDAAAGFTCEANNTTRISGGTSTTLEESDENILNGWHHLPAPECRYEFGGQTYCVIGLEAAPADALTMSGWAKFEEVG